MLRGRRLPRTSSARSLSPGSRPLVGPVGFLLLTLLVIALIRLGARVVGLAVKLVLVGAVVLGLLWLGAIGTGLPALG